jgi:hypothetical protein
LKTLTSVGFTQEYNDKKLGEELQQKKQNAKSNEKLSNHSHGYENRNASATETQNFLLKDLSDRALKRDEALESLSSEMEDELDESPV